ncbi:hypothetical protein V496_00417 [Pseudogymnoascus sp. VKM F-4515 (FW-2607)]|nr:hypothetical protein V496_00417 [Pseudogymnoascus sp. VKM F-4515 (FW-2607)]
MPEKAIICWVVGRNHFITTNDELYINLTEDDIAARLKQNRYERTKLENSSWLICRLKSLNTTREYLDEKEFLSNSSKRRSFDVLFMKYFNGDDSEIKILRALHTDIFILLCLTFNRTLFKAITEKGLQDVFAKLINGAFKEPWKIPQWVVHRAKDSIINFKSEEAEQLRQDLSQDTQQSKKSLRTTRSLGTHSTGVERQGLESCDSLLPPSTGERILLPIPPNDGILIPNPTNTTSATTINTKAALVPPNIPSIPHVGASKRKRDGDEWPTANTPFPTTSTVDTHNAGADESHEGSNEENTQAREPRSFLLPSTAWRTLPPLTPNRTNAEACALPSPSSYPSQQASTVRYIGGHSQNWHVHEQLPHGLNQESDSAASIPSARLLSSLESYLQETNVRAPKRKRVGDGSQDTTLSESDMSAWNGRFVGK